MLVGFVWASSLVQFVQFIFEVVWSSVTCNWNVVCMLEISLAFFVFHVSVYDNDLDPMITLNKRFKTPVRKIFPRFIVSPRLRAQGRCRKLLRMC